MASHVKLYPSRWFQLALFSFVSFSNALCWITFAPISILVENYYGVTSFEVIFQSLVYMGVYIVLVLPR